jgi:signal transduction histidine kinase
LRAVVETSPIAIVTCQPTGTILMTNESARALLGIGDAGETQTLLRYLDALGGWLEKAQEGWRTDLECRGRRADGTIFLAHVWLSAYSADSGIEVAAVIWDASEELRGRETAALDSMATTSRILLGAISHEVRNLSGAAANLHEGIGIRHRLAGDKDFQTLGSVLTALGALASSGLRTATNRASQAVDLGAVLDEFRIIIEPRLHDAGVNLIWNVPSDFPRVAGDHSGLLQVILNLANNSMRALCDAETKIFSVRFQNDKSGISLQIGDTGHGVRDPETVFRPFTSRRDGTGLGLYVSRAIVRSFGGDLRFEPQPRGACFVIELRPPVEVASTLAG